MPPLTPILVNGLPYLDNEPAGFVSRKFPMRSPPPAVFCVEKGIVKTNAPVDKSLVSAEHTDSGRARYVSVTDDDAVRAFRELSRLEGIIPALEPAHALAWVRRSRGTWPLEASVLVCLSGRGDKDVAHVADLLGASA